ncbi:hypothetical protein QBC37DRAFT_98918 [Rhypophila decipiens]|uniref:Uncharacterized protein n=1 Tax=Rhypophila decipiens TaxID=261697 RepID=A0AAN7AZK7_9PEZI|nr:hypothetical protein QBC37DRAFT_98918 [Rhypophila decipiens]
MVDQAPGKEDHGEDPGGCHRLASLPAYRSSVASPITLETVPEPPPTSCNSSTAELLSSIRPTQALVTETYIRVRWQWLILPILETVLTAGMLIITIVVDRRSGYPLLKSSSLGLLFYGLRRSNLAVDIEQAVSMTNRGSKSNKLESIVEKLVVQFKADTNGNLGFYHNRQA